MMKKLLFYLFTSLPFIISAQTTETHNLDWFAGVGNSLDLTIETGDTVIWTWTSPNHTVENDPSGSSVETFNSGFLGPTGSTFPYTFTTIGNNDYLCGVHGAASMSGTITVVVEGSLSTPEFSENINFEITPNPSKDFLNIKFSSFNRNNINVEVFNVLGKRIHKGYINQLSFSVDVSSWNNGVYLVKVYDEKSIQTKRFIKQ